MKNPWDVLRGQELPVVVFWVYCVLGMALAMMFLGMFVMTSATNDVSDRTINVAGYVFLAYVAWAHVSLWMCAFNAKSRAWAYVARTYAAVVLAGVVAMLIAPSFFTTDPEIEVLLVTPP